MADTIAKDRPCRSISGIAAAFIVAVYVVSESGTVKLSKITDTLKAMPLLSGSTIIIPFCC